MMDQENKRTFGTRGHCLTAVLPSVEGLQSCRIDLTDFVPTRPGLFTVHGGLWQRANFFDVGPQLILG